MSNKIQLQHQFYSHFINKKSSYLLSQRHLRHLINQQHFTIEQIFTARYDEFYIENICNKQVFEKSIDAIEGIVSSSIGIKFSGKNRSGVILQNQEYLKYYLMLLFTKDEKKRINKLIDENFNGKKQVKGEKKEKKENEEREEQNQGENEGMLVIEYILKVQLTFIQNLLGINKYPKQSLQSQYNQQYNSDQQFKKFEPQHPY